MWLVTLVIGEQLYLEKEPDNLHDSFTAAIIKNYVPYFIELLENINVPGIF